MSLLRVRGLEAFYGDFQALFGVDLDVGEGECVAVIGANGAGKTTLMRSIAGVLRNEPGMVEWEGRPVGDRPADEVVGLGVAMVPEGRRLFPSLSVEENLMIGAHGGRRGPWTLDAVMDLFPILRERRRSPATALSGGQQQMVAIGRALMANPRLLLCDEISLGLAPVVVREVYAALPRVRETAAVVVVEQDIGQALAVADRALCLMEGRATLEGRPAELTREAIHDAYFGAAASAAAAPVGSEGSGAPAAGVGGPARADGPVEPVGVGIAGAHRRGGAGAPPPGVGMAAAGSGGRSPDPVAGAPATTGSGDPAAAPVRGTARAAGEGRP